MLSVARDIVVVPASVLVLGDNSRFAFVSTVEFWSVVWVVTRIALSLRSLLESPTLQATKFEGMSLIPQTALSYRLRD